MPSIGFTAKGKGYFTEKNIGRKQERSVLKLGGIWIPL